MKNNYFRAPLAALALLLTTAAAVEAQNVGIGTTTPSQQLDVNGSVQLAPVLIEAIKELKQQLETAKTEARAARTVQSADHASLLTLQAQMARLLGEGTQASTAPRK